MLVGNGLAGGVTPSPGCRLPTIGSHSYDLRRQCIRFKTFFIFICPLKYELIYFDVQLKNSTGMVLAQ